ncbi:tetratricopeptide repeat protein [Actinokineospora sp. PR83]|uniref:tetratricopeptide repeat protein n=1 Tax=Actinokineospora sp. PR83 TaxID=2884908 RepID=UPI001F32CE1C|nr:tetratricopeptide repeat protein [Actinokineospora sp. PR83]MCG8915238.1 tetratricopeptide repeat protein [Actinokineospora sp. PR83]
MAGALPGVAVQAAVVHGGVHLHGGSGDTGGGVAVVTALSAADRENAGQVFVGRAAESDRVLAALAPGGVGGPVVVSALAGMGGIGKTALARHAAAVAVGRGWFAGGAFFVDLRGYQADVGLSAESVFAPLLRRFGLSGERIPTGAGEQAAVYDQVLRDLADQGRPVLLVLDNVGTAEQVRGLVPAPGMCCHRVLVTTRDTLALPGAQRTALDVLSRVESVELLDRALREHMYTDSRVGDDPGGALDLAAVCGGVPLAVRIAVGLLADDEDLVPAELAAELAEAGTDAFAHGETALGTVFAASYDRLMARDPVAAGVLRLIALNPGPDVSTEAVAALAGLPVPVARTRLRALQHAHLITRVDRRWRVHDLICRHTHDHAPIEVDDTAVAITRLLSHYTAVTHAADEHLRAWAGHPVPDRFADRAGALAWLDREHPALVGAVRLAVVTGHHFHATRLAQALTAYLSWRRHLTDWLVVAQCALGAAECLGISTTTAAAWDNLGLALGEARRFDEAITAHENAGDLYREVEDRYREGVVLNSLGAALAQVRRYSAATTAHRRSVDLHREAGDRHGEALARNNLGLVLRRTRRFDEAIVVHEQACDLLRAVGDRHSEAVAWNNLGLALRETGRLDDAIRAHRRARDLHQRIGDHHGEGSAWNNLGIALRQAGATASAITAHRTAITRQQRAGDRHHEGTALTNLGLALHRAQRRDEALDCWEQAAEAFRDVGDDELVRQVDILIQSSAVVRRAEGSARESE